MSAHTPRRIALTGATGFIGQHLLAALQQSGYSIKALTRRPQSKHMQVTWVEGDLHDVGALRELVAETDTLIHLAGAIKGRRDVQFQHANVQGTQNLLAAASDQGHRPAILYVSTQAARQRHLSPYAGSKAAAEDLVRASSLDWRIVRPPAVYGPGDRETFFFFRSALSSIAALPVPAAQKATLVHVSDLTDAILHVLEREQDLSGQVFEVSDALGTGYAAAELVREIATHAGTAPRIVHLPGSLLLPFSAVSQGWGLMTARDPMLTPGKLRELQHPDWSGQNLLQEISTWRPKITLRQGLAETLAWYRAENWL